MSAAHTTGGGALRVFLCALAVCSAMLGLAHAEAPADIEVFGRPGCPRCADAHAYLDQLRHQRPALRVLYRDVTDGEANLERLRELATRPGAPQAQVAVPAFYVKGHLVVGFESAATTGRTLERMLDGELVESKSAGTCSPDAQTACEAREVKSVRVPWVGEIDVRDIGLPVFTLVMGFIDGFNPCAMWVLLFVLSMLVNLKDRARMALVGGTFVLVSGVVYFAFMAAWLNFFLLVGLARAVQIVLGVIAIAIGSVHVKDFFAFQRGLSLSIPESAKPGIYRRARAVLHAENLPAAVLGIAGLAVLVNMVELLCTAGLPAIFTQVLTAQGVSPRSRYAYLALYNLAYVFDDALMLVVAVATLSRRKLQERGGRILKLISGLVIVALGLALVFKPEWLAWVGP